MTEEDQEKVKQLLKIDVQLDEDEAYQLKNKLDQCFKKSNEKAAKEGLETYLKEMSMSNIDSLHKVMKTCKRWR